VIRRYHEAAHTAVSQLNRLAYAVLVQSMADAGRIRPMATAGRRGSSGRADGDHPPEPAPDGQGRSAALIIGNIRDDCQRAAAGSCPGDAGLLT
jgi:hypothetical protein